MIRFFKRRRPTVRVQQLSREEIAELLIYRWHGLTPDEWTELPAIVKVDKREDYYRARGLGG